jgi:hypothetical protein
MYLRSGKTKRSLVFKQLEYIFTHNSSISKNKIKKIFDLFVLYKEFLLTAGIKDTIHNKIIEAIELDKLNKYNFKRYKYLIFGTN